VGSACKAMLFDLDGTLVDTLADLANAMNYGLRKYGLAEHSVAACRPMIGNGVETFALRAVGAGNEQLRDKVLAAMREYYAANWKANSRVYPGMAETVEKLRDRGIRLAVVTNKDHDAAREMVEYFFGKGAFAVIAGTDEQGRVKPDPASSLAVAKSLGVSTEECVFVGDSDVDIETAKAAGMRSVGVTWGFRPREVLENAGADVIVDTPGEILYVAA